jgi:hypothetical protein
MVCHQDFPHRYAPYDFRGGNDNLVAVDPSHTGFDPICRSGPYCMAFHFSFAGADPQTPDVRKGPSVDSAFGSHKLDPNSCVESQDPRYNTGGGGSVVSTSIVIGGVANTAIGSAESLSYSILIDGHPTKDSFHA